MAKQITRRELLGQSLMASALGLPLVGRATGQTAARLKVVVAGAHPDDPESGCGGTMALYSDMGHEVAGASTSRARQFSVISAKARCSDLSRTDFFQP